MSSLADRRRARRNGERLLRPIFPSAGIEASYRRRLIKLIDEMGKSTAYWLESAYRQGEPEIVHDELPTTRLKRSLDFVKRQWESRFDDMAEKLSKLFANMVARRVVSHLRKSVPPEGPLPTVKFTLSPAMRDVVAATVQANVALIKSIPAQYLEQVEGIVMRGVQNGRDLASVSKDLQGRLGVAKSRANLIAKDQNRKATSSITRAKWLELGLEEAIWLHSGGGREPRPTHLKAGREKTRYKVSEGWYDPAVKRHIQPGEEINCRCVGRPVVPGFS